MTAYFDVVHDGGGLRFGSVSTTPADGSTSAVSVGVGVGLGYGPISAGYDLSFQDTSGAVVSRSADGRSLHAEIDFTNFDRPYSQTEAVGVRYFYGFLDGALGSHATTGKGRFEYFRQLCVGYSCTTHYYTALSIPNNAFWGTQVDQWQPNTHIAIGQDYDYGDRTLTTYVTPESQPADRPTYFVKPTRVYSWQELEGPIIGSHSITWELYYWDSAQGAWIYQTSRYGEIPAPPVPTSWSGYRVWTWVDLSSGVSSGQWQWNFYVDGVWRDHLSFTVGSQ